MKNVRTLIAASILALSGTALAADSATPAFNIGWQSPEVQTAWNAGYKGQGVTITVVDDYVGSRLGGRLIAGKALVQSHGKWTSLEASLTAPEATVVQRAWGTSAPVELAKGLNVINASYGTFGSAAYTLQQVRFSGTEASIIDDAKRGLAVVVKAAGNDSVDMNTATKKGTVDFLAAALKGAPSAIYAGALDKNGTTTAKSNITTYSNKAGTDVTVQKQFLMVGVNYNSTLMSGTSFAAPIISGYAAIVGSKFTSASPTAVANQLLATARTDMINNYNAAVHGRGEASLTRALAPVSVK